MSAAWGTVTAILPALDKKDSFDSGFIVAFCFTFGIVFIRSAMSDILEMQRDKFDRAGNYSVFFGRERAINVLRVISFDIIRSSCFFLSGGLDAIFKFFLLICILYIWICFSIL